MEQGAAHSSLRKTLPQARVSAGRCTRQSSLSLVALGGFAVQLVGHAIALVRNTISLIGSAVALVGTAITIACLTVGFAPRAPSLFLHRPSLTALRESRQFLARPICWKQLAP